MASTTTYLPCHLPQSSETLYIPKTRAALQTLHIAPIPRLPSINRKTGPCLKDGKYLNDRLASNIWDCRRIVKRGYISDRYRRFVAHYLHLLRAARKSYKEDAQAPVWDTIRVIGEELERRWDEVHGPEGLCATLKMTTTDLQEFLWKVRFGDYFELLNAPFKTDARFAAQQTSRESATWFKFAEELEREERGSSKPGKPGGAQLQRRQRPAIRKTSKLLPALSTFSWRMFGSGSFLIQTAIERPIQE